MCTIKISLFPINCLYYARCICRIRSSKPALTSNLGVFNRFVSRSSVEAPRFHDHSLQLTSRRRERGFNCQMAGQEVLLKFFVWLFVSCAALFMKSIYCLFSCSYTLTHTLLNVFHLMKYLNASFYVTKYQLFFL